MSKIWTLSRSSIIREKKPLKLCQEKLLLKRRESYLSETRIKNETKKNCADDEGHLGTVLLQELSLLTSNKKVKLFMSILMRLWANLFWFCVFVFIFLNVFSVFQYI